MSSKATERRNMHFDLVHNYGWSGAEAAAIANIGNIHDAHKAYRNAKSQGPRPKKQNINPAPVAPTKRAAPVAPTNTLVSQLKMGQGGARPAKGKTTPRKTRDLIKTSSYIDPITSTMSATPYGSSLNLA